MVLPSAKTSSPPPRRTPDDTFFIDEGGAVVRGDGRDCVDGGEIDVARPARVPAPAMSPTACACEVTGNVVSSSTSSASVKHSDDALETASHAISLPLLVSRLVLFILFLLAKSERGRVGLNFLIDWPTSILMEWTAAIHPPAAGLLDACFWQAAEEVVV